MFSYVDGRCAMYLILVLCSHGDGGVVCRAGGCEGGVVCRAGGCEGVVGWRVGDMCCHIYQLWRGKGNCGMGGGPGALPVLLPGKMWFVFTAGFSGSHSKGEYRNAVIQN